MCQLSERIGDRDIKSAVMASVGAVIPHDQCWTVVLDEHGQPAAAIAADGAAMAEDLVVADAAVPVIDALETEALRRVGSNTVVVVTSGGFVVGVWSGEDLIDAVMHGGTRGVGESLPGDIQLPGPIRKKNITRHCCYTDHGRSCSTVLVVPEKPEEMPQCPTQAGISPHAFAW
jgi:hypothetical protein